MWGSDDWGWMGSPLAPHRAQEHYLRVKQYALAISLAVVSLSCAQSHTPAQASSPAPAPIPSRDVAPSVPPSIAMQVSVRDGVVFVHDQAVARPSPGQLKRLDGLFRTMRALAPAQRDGTYRLSVSGELDAAQFKSVTQTIGYAGWPVAVLDAGGRDVTLFALVPEAPNTPPRGLAFPKSVLSLIVRPGVVEPWRVSPTAAGAVPSSSMAHRLDSDEPLAHTLAQACEDLPCNPASLVATNDASFRAIATALAALAGVSNSAPLEVHLGVANPGPPGTPPPAPSSSAPLLAPVVIQSVVRAGYGRLRECYKSGLKNDSKLEGRVEVRFVINRDGTVSNVTLTPPTTLEDDSVVACMSDVFRDLVFPRPAGGVVNVVYPIMFAPQ